MAKQQSFPMPGTVRYRWRLVKFARQMRGGGRRYALRVFRAQFLRRKRSDTPPTI